MNLFCRNLLVLLVVSLQCQGEAPASGDTLRIYFPYAVSSLNTAGRESLDAGLYHEFFDRGAFLIYGYADASGDTAYNRRLSLDRAEAVKRYLTEDLRLHLAIQVLSGEGEAYAVQGRRLQEDRVVKIVRVQLLRPAPVAAKDTLPPAGTARVYIPKFIGLRKDMDAGIYAAASEINRRHYLAWSGRKDTLQDTVAQLYYGEFVMDRNDKKSLLRSWSNRTVMHPRVRGMIAMDLALTYAVERKADSLFHWLRTALDRCPYTDSLCDENIWDPNILGFYQLDPFKGSGEWKAFEARILRRFNARKDIQDKALALPLILAGGADQSVRGPMPVQDTARSRWQKKVHEENLALIRTIVSRKGFPRKSRVGANAANAAFLLVQHSEDTTLQKKVIDQMTAYLRTGDSSPELLAMLTDRYLVNTKGYQLYGTQFRGPHRELFPVLDMATVDERRARMGLEPLVRKGERPVTMYR